MPLFSPKPELGIVFHIGSSSVAAGLVRLQRGKVAQVVYTLREIIPYRGDVDPERFIADMIEALKRLNARLAKEGLANIEHAGFGKPKVRRISYIFSSPWSVTQTKIASVNKPEGFVLTKALVDSVVREQEAMFEKEMLGGAGLGEKVLAIEKRVVQIKLNGYEVEEPYGKKATHADISLLISLFPKAVVDKVFDISMSTYHPMDTEIFSFPLASFSTIREVFHNERDFIFIDVGGELSDVSIIKDGLILETASFPRGRNFLVRKIAKTFAMTPEEAVSLVKIYHSDHMDDATAAKLQPVIAAASLEWSAALHATLETISKKIALPTHLFAIINNDFVDFFMKALKEEKVSEFGLDEAPLSVVLVNHDKLRSVVGFSKAADKDPFIAVLAAFVSRVYESKAK